MNGLNDVSTVETGPSVCAMWNPKIKAASNPKIRVKRNKEIGQTQKTVTSHVFTKTIHVLIAPCGFACEVIQGS